MLKVCARCGKQANILSWERLCYRCSEIESVERIQAAVRAAGEDEYVDTWSDSHVICPYCGEALEANVGYEDFPEIYEDGDHELECPECGKMFTLNTNISYSWETEKLSEEAD